MGTPAIAVKISNCCCRLVCAVFISSEIIRALNYKACGLEISNFASIYMGEFLTVWPRVKLPNWIAPVSQKKSANHNLPWFE